MPHTAKAAIDMPQTYYDESTERQEYKKFYVNYDEKDGWYCEGWAPTVPEDGNVPGWVCFEIDDPAYPISKLRTHLNILGFSQDQVDKLMEAFDGDST